MAFLATLTLGATAWMWTLIAQPGANPWAAVGAGAASWFTVRLILAAAQAEARERVSR